MTTPLNIGFIGLDTSHVTAFTALLNNPGDPNHVPGGRLVVAFPGGSKDFELSWSRVDKFTAELREKFGVRIVDTPQAVAEASDLVFIESVDGRVHLDQFKKIVSHKKPVFIDKPFTTRSAEAREIFRLAEQAAVPVMSASSLRYYDNLVECHRRFAADAENPIVGADAFGPMSIEPTQGGLYWYGIHTVEAIVSVMGPGCAEVYAKATNLFDLVTATWSDGRIATVRGTRSGSHQFGITLHGRKSSEFVNLSAAQRPGYAGLLEAIMRSLPHGKSDIPQQETLDIIRLIEAANESRETGKVVRL